MRLRTIGNFWYPEPVLVQFLCFLETGKVTEITTKFIIFYGTDMKFKNLPYFTISKKPVFHFQFFPIQQLDRVHQLFDLPFHQDRWLERVYHPVESLQSQLSSDQNLAAFDCTLDES